MNDLSLILGLAFFCGFIAVEQALLYFFGEDALKRAVTFPWRYRQHRLFEEAFRNGAEFLQRWGEDQDFVEERLGLLARDLHARFAEQELSRHHGDRGDRKAADDEVRYAKGKFWQAHGVARHMGFLTKPSWRDYLPS